MIKNIQGRRKLQPNLPTSSSPEIGVARSVWTSGVRLNVGDPGRYKKKSFFLNYMDFYKVHGSPTLPPSSQCIALPRLPYRWGRRVKILIMLFFSTTIFSQPKITIQDLTPSSIEQLRSFSKNNPGPFTIDVVPQKEWLAAITGFVTTPFTALRNSLSLKNISLTLISGMLSLGWFSYLLCSYLIYTN